MSNGTIHYYMPTGAINIIMPIGAIFGSCSTCISCICISIESWVLCLFLWYNLEWWIF